jgi:hypothetical protein
MDSVLGAVDAELVNGLSKTGDGPASWIVLVVVGLKPHPPRCSNPPAVFGRLESSALSGLAKSRLIAGRSPSSMLENEVPETEVVVDEKEEDGARNEPKER